MTGAPRRKILFVITKSNWGGAQRYVYDLATHLPSDEFDVNVLFGGTGGKNAEKGVLDINLNEAKLKTSLKTFYLKEFMRDISFLQDFIVLITLFNFFRREQPEIIHLNSSKAGGLGALAARIARMWGTPIKKIVFTSHGLAYDEDRPFYAKALIWIATWATFFLCDEIITISLDNFERARKLPIRKEKISLIHNGIAQIDFLERDEARIKLVGDPINKDTLWIGSVAEFTKNKGATYLVEAASILKNRGLSFRLCMVGYGEDLQKIKNRAIEKGLYNAPGSASYIDLPGFVSGMDKLMKAFSIFVIPSIKEGLPYVLLEAGQAGCAVVATNISGMRDVMNESTGILVPPKDAAALANALERLLRNHESRHQLGTNIQTLVRSEFSLDTMVAKTAALYRA